MFKRSLPSGFDPVKKRKKTKRKSSPGNKFFRLLDRLGKKMTLQYIKDGSFGQVPRQLKKEKKNLNASTYKLLFDERKGLVSLHGDRLIVRPVKERSVGIVY